MERRPDWSDAYPEADEILERMANEELSRAETGELLDRAVVILEGWFAKRLGEHGAAFSQELKQCLDASPHDMGLAKLALYEARARHMVLLDDYVGAYPDLIEGLREATRLRSGAHIVQFSHLLAYWLHELELTDRARTKIIEASPIFDMVADIARSTAVTILLSRTELELGNYQAALDAGLRALEMITSPGFRRSVKQRQSGKINESYTHNNIADACIQLGQLDEAEQHLDQARALLDETQDPLGIIYNLRARGRLHLARHETRKALEHLETSRQLSSDHSLAHEVERSLLEMVEVHESAGDYQQALVTMRQHLQMYRARTNKLIDQQFAYINQTFETSAESAVQANHMTARLARTMLIAGHDLRTPLSSILLSLELIKTSADIDQTQQFAQRAAKATERAHQIVEQLLEVAQAGSGSHQTTLTDCDLAAIANDIVSRVKELAAHKRLSFKMPPSDSPQAFADRLLVGRIVSDLVSNAIKYSYPDTTITIAIAERDYDVAFSITDQGVGFAPDEAQHLFEEFSQLPSSRPTANESSMGLGLYLTALQASLINSRVEANSPGPDQGATFTLLIPKTTGLNTEGV